LEAISGSKTKSPHNPLTFIWSNESAGVSLSCPTQPVNYRDPLYWSPSAWTALVPKRTNMVTVQYSRTFSENQIPCKRHVIECSLVVTSSGFASPRPSRNSPEHSYRFFTGLSEESKLVKIPMPNGRVGRCLSVALLSDAFYSTRINLLPQKIHRFAASNSSETNQLCAAANNFDIGLGPVVDHWEGGNNAFLLHPMQVRTDVVARMKEVTEHRAVFTIYQC